MFILKPHDVRLPYPPVGGQDDGPTSSVDRLGMPVFCIGSVYAHHAKASGYHHLASYLGPQPTIGPAMRLAGETVLRIPAKLAGWYCGAFEYSRHNCIEELNTALHLLRRRNCIYHYLYGEKGYRFSGALNGVRGNRLIASFHHAPSRFNEMLQYKRHLRRLDHAIVLASNQVEQIERWVGRGKVSIVPHGVDTDYWAPDISRPRNDRLRCVFAGLHMRDFKTLERVVKLVHAADAAVDFVLLCRDEQCRPIASLPNVRWLPRTSDEDYRLEMRSADVLVLPLMDSTAVNSVLEAMSCGLAIVTTTGGISDYLESRFSFQIKQGDQEAMVEAILYLANDRDAVSQMQLAARKQAELFAWPKIADRVIEVYRRAKGESANCGSS